MKTTIHYNDGNVVVWDDLAPSIDVESGTFYLNDDEAFIHGETESLSEVKKIEFEP